MELRHRGGDTPLTGVVTSSPDGTKGRDLAGVDCLAEGVATHMMEVLKELSAAATGMFSLGGGRPALGGLQVVVPLAIPSVGGALTCCLGGGAFLDCLGGVVSLLRISCLDRFEDSTCTLVRILIGLGTWLFSSPALASFVSLLKPVGGFSFNGTEVSLEAAFTGSADLHVSGTTLVTGLQGSSYTR